MPAPELNDEEREELLELRALKNELAAAGWPGKKVTRDNLLMKQMGGEMPYRYDPLPPDVYLAIYADKSNDAWLRALAWLMMNTIAIGRHSSFAVDDYGRPLDVVAMAAVMGWGIKHAEATLLELETRGFIKRDPAISGKSRRFAARRIFLNATNVVFRNADSKSTYGNATAVQPPGCSPSLRLEPYIRKHLETIDPAIKEAALARHAAIHDFGWTMHSDAVAAVRRFIDGLVYQNWTWAGVPVREKPLSTRSAPAQLHLDERRVSAGYVQLDLALALPAEVRVPEAPPGPAAAEGLDAQLSLIDERINALYDEQITLMQASRQEPAQAMHAGRQDVSQAPAAPVPASQKLEAVHAKKSRVQTPISLLVPLPPTAPIENTVEILNTLLSSSSAASGEAGTQHPSSYTRAKTTTTTARTSLSEQNQAPATPNDGTFAKRVFDIFGAAGKGMPTPAQLAAAWKLMPAGATVDEFEQFLTRPAGQARIDRAQHPGALKAISAEFAIAWTKARKHDAVTRPAPRIHCSQCDAFVTIVGRLWRCPECHRTGQLE